MGNNDENAANIVYVAFNTKGHIEHLQWTKVLRHCGGLNKGTVEKEYATLPSESSNLDGGMYLWLLYWGKNDICSMLN